METSAWKMPSDLLQTYCPLPSLQQWARASSFGSLAATSDMIQAAVEHPAWGWRRPETGAPCLRVKAARMREVYVSWVTERAPRVAPFNSCPKALCGVPRPDCMVTTCRSSKQSCHKPGIQRLGAVDTWLPAAQEGLLAQILCVPTLTRGSLLLH